jgi:16S rRNA (adenine1518-N6/adenine1519-N6)-dimethyltransferase
MSPQPLGQNFLADPVWRERITRAALALPAFVDAPPKPSGIWIEIGAGHGEMTVLLAPHVSRLIAIELDDKLLPRLREQTVQLSNVTVFSGDVLTLNLPELAGGERFRVYGNLPYYITSPIIHQLFALPDRLDAAFIVVQLEVAERLVATPGHRDYGYLSTFAQFYSQPQILARIPPGAFRPRPKVSSALVAMRLPGERTQLGIADEPAFMNFLKGCFAQKRKTLRNNLRLLMEPSSAEHAIETAGLAPSVRAEQLTLPQFARLFTLMQTSPAHRA